MSRQDRYLLGILHAHGVFMYGVCMLSQAHYVSFERYVLKKVVLAWLSVMHVQDVCIIGHYVVVKGCLCMHIA